MIRLATLFAAALLSVAVPAVSNAQDYGRGRDRGGDQGGRGSDRGGGGDRHGQTISMSQAVSIARSRSPGSRVLDAGLAGRNYRVRLMVEGGRVVDYVIDAESGAILSAN